MGDDRSDDSERGEREMKGVRCHITGKSQRPKRCLDLRRYWGYEGCHLVCGLIPYADREKIKRAREEKKQQEREKKMEAGLKEFKAFLKSTGDDD
jgi:hypothetical protein